MTWPQVVMLVWLLFGTVMGIKRTVSNRDESSAIATFGVFIVLAIEGAVALVLHAGGFW